MAQVGLTLDFSGYTGSLLVVWKKATAPLAEVGRSAALSFPVAQVVTASNLTDEGYIFEFWQSSDGTALTTLLRTWSIDASAYSGALAVTYDYVVGRGNATDPANGATSIVDTRLASFTQDDLLVFKEGFRPLRKDEYTIPTPGTIALNPLYPLNTSETVLITTLKKISSSGGPTDYTAVKVVSASATVDTTYKNKLIQVTAAASVCTLTFPAFNTLSDQKMKIVTHGMTSKNLVLQFAIGNTVAFNGSTQNVLYLGKGQYIELVILSGVCYVLSDRTGWSRVGKRELVDAVGINQLPLDGTEYNTADYPGFIAWMLFALSASQVLTVFGTWNTTANKHLFFYDSVNGKFRVPDDRNMHYRTLKTFDNNNASDLTRSPNVPGGYQADQVGDHKHELPIGDINFNGDPPGTKFRGDYSNAHNGTTDYTLSNTTAGAETNTKNVGQIAVINIA